MHGDLESLRLLELIERRHREQGDVVILAEGEGLFTGASDSTGCAVVFGAAHNEQVLSRNDLFERIPSKVHSVSSLNAGLFNMRGKQHKRVRTLISSTFNPQNGHMERCLRDVAANYICALPLERELPLVATMRALALDTFGALILGPRLEENRPVITLVEALISCRRQLNANLDPTARNRVRAEIHSTGIALDRCLRARMRQWGRAGNQSERAIGRHFAVMMSEDHAVEHIVTTFLASTEASAVAVCWTLILLSFSPLEHIEVRDELRTRPTIGGNPTRALEQLVKESLRILPPIAFIVRRTTVEMSLGPRRIPKNCEVVVTPFFSHRDKHIFDEPTKFRPQRWSRRRPPRFSYIPFSGGPHHCPGNHLAFELVTSVVGKLLSDYDIEFTRSHLLGWELNITLMPSPETGIRLSKPVKGKLPSRRRLPSLLNQLFQVD